MQLVYLIFAALFGFLLVFGLLQLVQHIRTFFLLRSYGFKRVKGGRGNDALVDPAPGCWLMVYNDYEKEGELYRVTVISRGLLFGELIVHADAIEP